MRKLRVWGIGVLVTGLLAVAAPLKAQNEKPKKAPLYVYVSHWSVPRAQWPAMEKSGKEHLADEQKLLNEGTITGFGEFINLIHTQGGETHGDFFFATSEGNVVKALAAFGAEADSTSPVLAASKHDDEFLISRIHNMRSGRHNGAYLAGSMWQVKPGQMEAFLAMVKASLVPLLEKELKAGALVYYSVDTEDYHTHAPGIVDVVLMAADAAALDKVNAAFEAAFSNDKEIGPAVGALTVRDSHRDFLYRVAHMVVK